MPQTKLPTFAPIVHELNKNTMTVKIHMDKRGMSQIVKRANEYKAVPSILRPAMEDIGDYVRDTMIPGVFRAEGPGWRQLAIRTKRERVAAGYPGAHPILQRSRDLYKELTDKSHPRHIEIIKVGKYARIELGGSSTKFLENQLGKESQHLPARPMIPGTGDLTIRDRDRNEMAKIIQRAYKRAIERPN